MVHTVHPVWGNRSCLRFGIYSEALDDEHVNRPKFKTRRLGCCVVAGMVLVTTLLIGLMVFDMLGGHGTPSRDKDAVQHLLSLRRTTIPTPVLKTTIASTFGTTTTATTTTVSPNTITSAVVTTRTEANENTLEPHKLPDYHNVSIKIHNFEKGISNSSREESEALPYKYGTKESRSNTRRSGKQRYSDSYDSISEFSQHGSPPRHRDVENDKENYPRYWVSSHKRSDPEVHSRIMNHGVPRPFRARNFTTERPANNRIKIIKNDVIPNYGFTSLSKYPQLSSYRYPNEAKNIQDIIKYLTAGDSTQSFSTKQHDTLVFQPPTSSSNNRKIKFAGIYKTREKEEAGEMYSKPDESLDKYTLSGHENKMTDTSSLNGHAYIADPFHAFKPSDPSEINLLANSDFRFSPIDNRFRITSNRIHGNRWPYEPNPNDKYFPRPPINFGKQPLQNNNHEPVLQVYPGTYTTATFRPFGKDAETQPSTSQKTKKMKPFSVMLDIYPMMEDSQPQATMNKVKPRGRPGGQSFGHVRFPHVEHVRFTPDQVAESSDTKHQMIVHLNLYPKNKKNPSISNRNDDIPTFHVDVNPYCCDGEESERFSNRAYDENMEDDIRTEDNPEKYEEEGDEDNEDKDIAWKISELVADVTHPQGTISGDSKTETQEDTSPRANVFQTTRGSAQHSTNDKKPYTSLDVRLQPDNEYTAAENTPNVSKDRRPLNSDISEFYLSADK